MDIKDYCNNAIPDDILFSENIQARLDAIKIAVSLLDDNNSFIVSDYRSNSENIFSYSKLINKHTPYIRILIYKANRKDEFIVCLDDNNKISYPVKQVTISKGHSGGNRTTYFAVTKEESFIKCLDYILSIL